MAKIAWDTFVQKHKRPRGFSAAVSAALRKGPAFDKSRKKLPTPYGLFQEWASTSLAGDWATVKFPGGFIICVADDSDASTITNEFGVIGAPKPTPACTNTQQIGYRDADYKRLAKSLGYNL